MSRNLKALGLALFAVFAMSALSVSAASAAEDKFHSEGSPTTLTASADAVGGTQVFQTPEGEVKCTTVSLDNTTITGTSVSEVTAHPTYSNCEVVRGAEHLAADVEFTNASNQSCDYLFTGETNATGHSVVHIKCETGGEIKIKATVAGIKVKCLAVPAQTPTGGGVKYNNIGAGANREVTIEATVSGIEYTVENSICGTVGTANNATYNGNVVVTGENSLGEMTGIWFE